VFVNRSFSIDSCIIMATIYQMLSLKNEADVLSEVRKLIRDTRISLSWRQEDLASHSGVGVATVNRFERTGRIGFLGLAKIMTTLGLTDPFLAAFRKPPAQLKNIQAFLAPVASPRRVRTPRRAQGV